MGERGERGEAEGVSKKGAMQKSAGTKREREGEKPNRRAACRAGRVARCTYPHTDREGDREAGRV